MQTSRFVEQAGGSVAMIKTLCSHHCIQKVISVASENQFGQPQSALKTLHELPDKQVGVGSWCFKVRTLILEWAEDIYTNSQI